MGHSADSIFDHPSVTMPRQIVGQYCFFLKDIETEITIQISKLIGEETVFFSQSHFIKTPLQPLPYKTSRPWNDSPGRALHQVVHALTQEYDAAVAAGHQPSEDWLVPNERFPRV
jgi:hypothetical protein